MLSLSLAMRLVCPWLENSCRWPCAFAVVGFWRDEVWYNVGMRFFNCLFVVGLALGCVSECVAEKIVWTAGKPAALLIVPEQDSISVASDLGFFRVSVVDKDGNVCPNADNRINVTVSGEAKFKGICNGDETSLEPFVKPTMKAFKGWLVVPVEAGGSVGMCSVEVAADGLGSASSVISIGKRK